MYATCMLNCFKSFKVIVESYHILLKFIHTLLEYKDFRNQMGFSKA